MSGVLGQSRIMAFPYVNRLPVEPRLQAQAAVLGSDMDSHLALAVFGLT